MYFGYTGKGNHDRHERWISKEGSEMKERKPQIERWESRQWWSNKLNSNYNKCWKSYRFS